MNTLRCQLKCLTGVSDENVTLLFHAYADLTSDDTSRAVAFALLFGHRLYAFMDDGELSQYYNGEG